MNKKHIYVRLLEYTRPYFPRLFAALGCMVLASVFTVIPPWLLKNVVDDVLIAKKMDVLNVLTIGLVLLFTGKGIASYGHQYLMNWVGQHVVMDLRVGLYDHMQNLSLRYIYGKLAWKNPDCNIFITAFKFSRKGAAPSPKFARAIDKKSHGIHGSPPLRIA
jgi:ABC-type multidrug transport system fused ATPase/permease subunit